MKTEKKIFTLTLPEPVYLALDLLAEELNLSLSSLTLSFIYRALGTDYRLAFLHSKRRRKDLS